ncbi:TPA: type IA DNA topoisomerase [Clostridium botulinum]|uniref:type IA DNA topoisomerase n=1 Tax=Clostridium TaxID=1485 RepID=UPI000774C5E0|nr:MULTISPECIES: DNA topoisomerase [Clostridium]AUM95405.1 DNA topoisomerase III [Clostridium sporogenes]AVQ52847.1 DNA topoisomerase III [Clostridium botulinum]MBO0524086.1 type IA DNA topoisomerase [Clostridium botulinum]MBO0532080.1 type IA DNA topoisomerase [Clostridium botulinum]MBO0547067.1 type IA DNA topoisomerase [Clostridium botulinum]
MSKLLLAEKPSVARNIGEALGCKTRKNGYLEGNGYIVTWAFGHLLTLYDCKDYDPKLALWSFENFPYIPKEFKYKIKNDGKNRNVVDSGAKKQLEIIKELINREEVEEIISATDYDREGELIALLIFNYLKANKPIYRILINEWTPTEIKKGLKDLKKNEEMINLQDAGVSRQLADWVIGINFTSIATMKYTRGKGNLLNIGRVLMPTLKIIYDREMEIKNFKVEEFYELEATFKNEKGEYKGKFFYGKKEKFPNKKIMEKLKAEIKDRNGLVTEKTVEIKKENPPSLFNLSNLQGYITSKYKGFTADKVLKVSQSLYEKKYITYPRTESTALEESIKDKAKKVLEVLKNDLPFKEEIVFNTSKKVFNNAKVESHSAIMPTYIIPKNLTPDERLVYDAVKNRFISQFMKEAQYENTEIVTTVLGENYERLFKTKGKILKAKGWLKLYKEKKKDELLPPIEKDDEVEMKSLKIISKKTKPPAHHTEKTLLKAMETCGKNTKQTEDNEEESNILYGYSIGTAATRAETINKLKYAGYITPKGKSLLITDKGTKLIETFPIRELLDTDYTGKLEKKLYDMEKGKFKREDFLKEIFNFTVNGVNKIKNIRSNVICDTRVKNSK